MLVPGSLCVAEMMAPEPGQLRTLHFESQEECGVSNLRRIPLASLGLAAACAQHLCLRPQSDVCEGPFWYARLRTLEIHRVRIFRVGRIEVYRGCCGVGQED